MPAVPAPPTFTNPQILNDTDLNSLAAAIRFLQAPPCAELLQTALQTFTTGTAAALAFDAETFDLDVDGVGGHDNAANNSRYTARYAGRYQVSGGVTFVANATGRRGCWLRVNGTDINGSLAMVVGSADGPISVASRTKQVFLSVGDYVELVAVQNSGGNLATSVSTSEQPHMSVRLVSN